MENNQPIKTKGTATYPPNDNITSGFSLRIKNKACIKPIGIFRSEGIVKIVKSFCNLPVIIGINFIPRSGRTCDSIEGEVSPSLVVFLPIYTISILVHFLNYTLFCLEMFKSMPTAVKFATRADPPYEINGKGTPVKGSNAIIEDKFIAIWIPNQEVNPIAKILPKLSEQSCAILRPLNTTKKNNPIKTAAPKKPNSSPTIPNIESVETSGIYSNFCLE